MPQEHVRQFPSVSVGCQTHAGANPTRVTLMKALRNLKESGANHNPFVYPGMVVKTSSTRNFPMEQLILQKWSGTTHDWQTFGGVLNSGF